MIVTLPLQAEGLQTLEQIRALLDGSQPMGFEIPSREAANDLIAQTLRRFGYARLSKADKGLVRRYLCKVTGRSRAQTPERFLLPVLEALIHGFHADNGSGYINRQVAALLGKLHVEEFTKSRARRTNDNALVESKNGSVVRKHLGYAHIPGRFAQRVNHFTQNVLSPYLNFHRPCFFPTEEIDTKGRAECATATRT